MPITLIRSFLRALRTRMFLFLVFITMSSVPLQALKTNSLIAIGLFELVVAGLVNVGDVGGTRSPCLPN